MSSRFDHRNHALARTYLLGLVLLVFTACGGGSDRLLSGIGGTPTGQIEFQVPGDGAQIDSPLSITVSGEGITQVEFLLDGGLALADDEAPFEWTLDPQDYAAGAHVLTVWARLPDGDESVTVNIATSLPAPTEPPPKPVPNDQVLAAIRAMPANSWLELDDTSPSSLTPTPTPAGDNGPWSVTDAWSGGTLVPSVNSNPDYFIIWGGGHRDYSGNEVYAFDLTAFKWSLLSQPTPASQVRMNVEKYDDGNPPSPHSYFNLTHDGKGNFVTIGNAAVYGSVPPTYRTVWRFNIADGARDWDMLSPDSAFPKYGSPLNGAAVADPENPGEFWVMWAIGNSSFFGKYVIGTGWQQLDTNSLYRESAIAVDTAQKFVVGLNGDFSNGIAIWRADNQPEGKFEPTVSGSALRNMISQGAHGLDYRTADGKMYTWSGGDSIAQFKANTTSITATELKGSGATPPKEPGTGTFGRWRYWADEDVFICMGDYFSNIFIYRPPAAN